MVQGKHTGAEQGEPQGGCEQEGGLTSTKVGKGRGQPRGLEEVRRTHIKKTWGGTVHEGGMGHFSGHVR